MTTEDFYTLPLRKQEFVDRGVDVVLVKLTHGRKTRYLSTYIVHGASILTVLDNHIEEFNARARRREVYYEIERGWGPRTLPRFGSIDDFGSAYGSLSEAEKRFKELVRTIQEGRTSFEPTDLSDLL